MTEVARQVARLADAVERHNSREIDAEFEREMAAIRDVPRITGAVRRGLVRNLVRAGLFHTAIPRAAWKQTPNGIAVRCNCGSEHEIPPDALADEVDCGRRFLFDGVDVRVAIRPAP
jgi:hypothetical protein